MAKGDDNVVILPNWKRNPTAYERLSELALMAREQPEKFADYIVVYKEETLAGTWKIRTLGTDESSIQTQIGLLQLGIMRIFDNSTE